MDLRMPLINTVTFSGYLTADPKTNTTSGGKTVASLNVAQNRRYRTRDGEWKDAPTTFVPVVVWGKLAEVMGSKLHKGSPVVVSGELQLTSWTTRDGAKRSRLEIKATSIQAIEKTGGYDEPPTDAYEEAPEADGPDYTDDIQF